MIKKANTSFFIIDFGRNIEKKDIPASFSLKIAIFSLLISIFFLLLLINISFATDNQITLEKKYTWTKLDTALEATWIILNIIDWGQTSYVAKNPDKYYETNPILGKHPSIGKVNSFFFLTTIAHPIIASQLPKNYRRAFQIITIGISGAYITNNFNIGIKINF